MKIGKGRGLGGAGEEKGVREEPCGVPGAFNILAQPVEAPAFVVHHGVSQHAVEGIAGMLDPIEELVRAAPEVFRRATLEAEVTGVDLMPDLAGELILNATSVIPGA